MQLRGLAAATYSDPRIFLYTMDLSTSLLHLQARRQLQNFDAQELVDWAVAALVAGYETEHLVMLAGMDRDSREEKEAYFERAVQELSIPLPAADDSTLRAYASHLAQAGAQGTIGYRDALNQLLEIYRLLDYEPRYLRLFELGEDLLSMDAGYPSFYSAQLSPENAEQIVRETFAHFLAGEALGIDPWQPGWVYCFACGAVGAPTVKRDWLARLHLLPGKEVCATCGSDRIAYFTDDMRRGDILEDMVTQRK